MVALGQQENKRKEIMKFLERRKLKKIYDSLTDQEKEFYQFIKIKDRSVIQLQQRGIKNPRAVLRNVTKKGITSIVYSDEIFHMEENNNEQQIN